MSHARTTLPAERRVRRFSARAAVALAVAAAAMLLPSLTPIDAAAPAADAATAADHAAGWLARQLDAGIPMQNFGSPDWGVTLDAAISLAAAEVGATQLDAVWTAMVADRDAVIDPYGSGDAPGRLARIILLAHAIGEDPTAVGAGPGEDMVVRLLATEQSVGADAGLFGTSASATYDGAFRQGYSLAALDAAGVAGSDAAWQWLIDQQCADGSWMPYRADTSVACAFDGTLFVGPDSNSTAAAMNGLVAVSQGAAAVAAGADWLAASQNTDGGWGMFPGDVSEPSSTALVWQSLVVGGFGADAPFLAKGATPMQALMSFQLGCSSPEEDRGAFTYPGSNDAPNGFSTAQAVPAAAGVPLVFGPVTAADTSPVLDCSTPTTTTSTTTTTTVAGTTTAAGAGASVAGAAAGNTTAANTTAGNAAARSLTFVG